MSLQSLIKEKAQQIVKVEPFGREMPTRYDGDTPIVTTQRGRVMGCIPVMVLRNYIDNNGEALSTQHIYNYVFPSTGYFRERKQWMMAGVARVIVADLTGDWSLLK